MYEPDLVTSLQECRVLQRGVMNGQLLAQMNDVHPARDVHPAGDAIHLIHDGLKQTCWTRVKTGLKKQSPNLTNAYPTDLAQNWIERNSYYLSTFEVG